MSIQHRWNLKSAFAESLLVLAVLFGLSSAACAEDLQSPFAFAMQGSSAGSVEKALREAIAGRHWTIVGYKPQDMQVKLDDGDKSVTVEMTWDASGVTIVYVDSKGLDYKATGGKPTISHLYARWLNNLKRDAVIFLSRTFGNIPPMAPLPAGTPGVPGQAVAEPIPASNSSAPESEKPQ